MPYDATEISAWLQDEEAVAEDRANGAAKEIAVAWNEGDFDYQTVKDVLGDWLTDNEHRPKYLVDPLAEHFDITLTD